MILTLDAVTSLLKVFLPLNVWLADSTANDPVTVLIADIEAEFAVILVDALPEKTL